jgi:hypothetical protein
VPSSGGDAAFLITSIGTTVADALSYSDGTALKVNAPAIDGRSFVAYVEDNGVFRRDVFRLRQE